MLVNRIIELCHSVDGMSRSHRRSPSTAGKLQRLPAFQNCQVCTKHSASDAPEVDSLAAVEIPTLPANLSDQGLSTTTY